MSRLDEAIDEMIYITDCLRALRDIWETGRDCNTCDISRECKYVPYLGQQTRYNCPLWVDPVTVKVR